MRRIFTWRQTRGVCFCYFPTHVPRPCYANKKILESSIIDKHLHQNDDISYRDMTDHQLAAAKKTRFQYNKIL